MQYQNNEPIYLQIIHDFKSKIVSGAYPPGSKVLPVRECAIAYAVNPNTMQKALSILEQEGLVYTKRTAGRFISEDAGRIARLKEEMVSVYVKRLGSEMRSFGISDEVILTSVREELKRNVDGSTSCK